MVCCWVLSPLHNYNRPTTQPPFSISTQPIATHNISISLPSCLFVSFLSICLFVFESERFLHPFDAIFLIVKCQFCPRLFLFNAALRFMNGCSDWGQLYKSARLQFGCRQGLRLIWDKFAITTHPPSIIWVKDQFAPNCTLSIKMKKPTLLFLCPTVSHVFSTIWRQIIIKQQCCCVSQPHRVVVCIVW